ncbi:hypothetical protein MRX96_027526 [Rhipicephalus microplus]
MRNCGLSFFFTTVKHLTFGVVPDVIGTVKFTEHPFRASFQIHFEGEATDGGFALDDITMYEGNCETRPPTAIIPVASTDV